MKKKFTLIDAGIIIIVLALLVVGINVLDLWKPEEVVQEEEKHGVTFTVLCDSVDEGFSKRMKAGDKVKITYGDDFYVTIDEVIEEPLKEHKYIDSKGEYITHTVEGKSSLRIRLKDDAIITKDGVIVANAYIRVGDSLPIYTKEYALVGYIIDIDEKGFDYKKLEKKGGEE